jgi:hypothetical protein
MEDASPRQLSAIFQAQAYSQCDCMKRIAGPAKQILTGPASGFQPLIDIAMHHLRQEIQGLQNGGFAYAIHAYQAIEFAQVKFDVLQRFEISDADRFNHYSFHLTISAAFSTKSPRLPPSPDHHRTNLEGSTPSD